MKICRLQFKLLSLVFAFSCLGLLLSANTVKATIIESDLAAYWSFDNGCQSTLSGDNAYKNSSQDLTIFGGLTSTSSTAIFGNSLYINGAGLWNGTASGCYRDEYDAYNHFQYFQDINENGSSYFPNLSYSFHLKLGNQPTGDSGDDAIIYHSGNIDSDESYMFSIHQNRHFKFAFRDASNNAIVWYSDNTIDQWNSSNWIHVVVEFGGSSMSTTFKVYVDGVEVVGTWSSSPDVLPRYNGANDGVVLGSRMSNSYRASTYNGYIDDFAVFSKLLSEEEIGFLGEMTALNAINYIHSYSYCGDGVCDAGETSLTCIDCLTIESMTDVPNVYFKFNNYSNYCQINETCKIGWTFDSAVFLIQDYGKFYWYDNATATPEYLGIKPLNTAYELGNYYSGYYATSSAATSSSYSFLAVEPWSTVLNSYLATSTTGIWWVEPKNWQQIEIDYYSSTTAINIGEAQLNFKAMACSADEWAETAESGVFNFTKLKCNTVYSFLLMGNTLAKIPSAIASNFSYLFKTIFPFNVGVKIKQSWDASASSTLPADMAWLSDEIDENGNITINTGALIGTTSSTTIWGENIANGNETFEIWRIRIRNIIGYLIWGAFIYFSIIKRGMRIYDKIKSEV